MTITPDPAQRAEKLAEEGHLEEAIVAYDAALATSPDDLSLVQNKAYALVALGRTEEAIACHDRNIAQHPRNPVALAAKADLLAAVQHFREARRELEKAISIAPDSFELWWAKGFVSFQMGDLEGALQYYERALVLNPESDDLWSEKADILLALGAYEEALAAYRHVSGLKPATARDWVLRGDRFLEKHRPQEASSCYDEAIKLSPESFEAWSGKGRVAASEHDLGAAIGFLDKAAAFTGRLEDRAIVLTYKGNVFAEHSDRASEALDCYKQAIQADPKQLAAWWATAVLLENRGEYQQALDAYEHVIELNRERADAWAGRGRCLTHLPQQLEHALECFNKAIELDPGFFWARNDRGWVLGELGRYAEAVDECAAAIRINPREYPPWVNQSFALMNLGRLTECEQLLKDGMEQVSDPRPLLTSLGGLYAEYMFEDEKALEISERLVEEYPNADVDTRTSYAENLLRAGHYSKAREYARAIEESETGAMRSVAGLIRLASYALEGNVTETHSYFAKFIPYLAETNRVPVTEDQYAVRGLTKRLTESPIDTMAKFVVMTLLDLLTGKLDLQNFSYQNAVLPPTRSSPASAGQ